jgi:hypothetical protein
MTWDNKGNALGRHISQKRDRDRWRREPSLALRVSVEQKKL